MFNLFPLAAATFGLMAAAELQTGKQTKKYLTTT
jgi:hypothetical protein